MIGRRLVGVATCALAFSFAPGLASAGVGHDDLRGFAQHDCRHYDGDREHCRNVQAANKAWRDYLTAVDDVTDQLQQSPNYETDPIGLFDIQTGMILTNIKTNMSSAGSGIRGMRPRWDTFDTPNERIGVDNPDTRYLAVWIPNGAGDQVYKVYGNRSNSCDMITLVNDPTDPMGGGDTLEDEDMRNTSGGPLGPNEDFEIFLSTPEMRDSAWHNWMQIGASDELNISQRYTVCNYHTERPGDVFVERVAANGVAITAEEFRDLPALTRGMERATATLVNQQPFWGTFSDLIMNSGLPQNVIAPWGMTGGLGITSQLTTNSWLVIPDGMALVVKVRTDYPGAYGSFQMYNAWGSSLPWGHHMANGSFEISGSAGNSYFTPSAIEEPINPQLCAPPTADPATCQGDARYTYIVVSNEDPVTVHPITGDEVVPHNWIGTMGHSPIFFAGRLQSVPNSGDPTDPNNPFVRVQGVGGWMPFAYLVPIQAITPFSPALAQDMQFITTDQRSAQIRERQLYQKDKYAPF